MMSFKHGQISLRCFLLIGFYFYDCYLHISNYYVLDCLKKFSNYFFFLIFSVSCDFHKRHFTFIKDTCYFFVIIDFVCFKKSRTLSLTPPTVIYEFANIINLSIVPKFFSQYLYFYNFDVSDDSYLNIV